MLQHEHFALILSRGERTMRNQHFISAVIPGSMFFVDRGDIPVTNVSRRRRNRQDLKLYTYMCC